MDDDIKERRKKFLIENPPTERPDKEEFYKRFFGKRYMPGLRDIIIAEEYERELEESYKRTVAEDNEVKAIQNLKPISCPLEISSNIPNDSWLVNWSNFSKEVSRRKVYDRTNHWIDGWAIMKDGTIIKKSTNLNSWGELHSNLLSKECILGQIAVRQNTPTTEAKPGFTFILADPSAQRLAKQMISIFKRHGLVGAIDIYDHRERWANFKYIFTPHWYAKTDERIFKHNWKNYFKPNTDINTAKKLWCEGAKNAIHAVLVELPENYIESIYLDSYATNDEIDLLSKEQLRTIRITKPDKLEALLLEPKIPPTGFWAGLFK